MEINDNEDDNTDEIVEEFDFEAMRKNLKEKNKYKDDNENGIDVNVNLKMLDYAFNNKNKDEQDNKDNKNEQVLNEEIKDIQNIQK